MTDSKPMGFASAESEANLYRKSGIRRKYEGNLGREAEFYLVWLLFQDYDSLIGEDAARTAFNAGWESLPDALTPLTDAELDSIIDKWSLVVETIDTLEDAQKTILRLVAEIGRLRAKD